MTSLTDNREFVNHEFTPGAAITLRRPSPRTFMQSGRLVASWDTTVSAAGTVARLTSSAGQVFVRVTPDPAAGFGEFAFFPQELAPC